MIAQAYVPNFDESGNNDLYSVLLSYGLFVGAIFQLICIVAAILLPATCDGDNSSLGEEQKSGVDGVGNGRRQHKLRKLEKKKRR